MTKRQHAEVASSLAQESGLKPDSLPTITHLQFLVLDLLANARDGLSAQLLKDGVALISPDYGGPKFYQLMGRLAEAGLIANIPQEIDVAGGAVTRTFYKVTPAGEVAWRITAEFYSSRRQFQKAVEKT